MIRTSFLIPTRYNNGDPIETKLMEDINNTLITHFGGYTIECTTHGAWFNTEEGKTYFDECLKYAVAIEPADTEKFRWVMKVFREFLKQHSLYVEIGNSVEFI